MTDLDNEWPPTVQIAAERSKKAICCHMAAGIPVKMVQAAAQWDAVAKWSFHWLDKHYPDRPVTVTFDGPLSATRSSMTLRNYMRLTETSVAHAPPYVRLAPLPGAFAELLADIERPVYCPPDRAVMVHLWIGPANTVQPFHKDNQNPLAAVNNILAQVYGTKLVCLVSSKYDASMYPHSRQSLHTNYSQLNYPHVDLDRFPLFRDAVVAEATIEPSDMIFIPANTWHYVRSVEPSISVSFWWYKSIVAELISLLGSQRNADHAYPFSAVIDELAVDEFGGIWAFALAARTIPVAKRAPLYAVCNPSVGKALLNALLHIEESS